MGFLSEIIATNSNAILSPFTECIILATICGRSIAHRQQSTVERVYGHVSQAIWDQHRWLDTMLTQRINILALQYPSISEHVDPMLLFAHMVAQSVILHMYRIIQPMSQEGNDYQVIVVEYQNRAIAAAHEIVLLTQYLSQLGHIKASHLDYQLTESVLVC